MNNITIGILLLLCVSQTAQSQKQGWQNMDLRSDGYYGISIEKAYTELLKDRKSKRIIVAVIDSGIDTTHEDLKSNLYINLNGSRGLNFIGQEAGEEDITRLVGEQKDFYDSLSFCAVPVAYQVGYQAYKKLAPALDEKIDALKHLVTELSNTKKIIDRIETNLRKNDPKVSDFTKLIPESDDERKVLNLIIQRLPDYKSWKECKYKELTSVLSLAINHMNVGLNLNNHNVNQNTATDYDISPDALGFVNNANIVAYHGTHVAGIIAAKRNNMVGINGVADNVLIMAIKVNGNIREVRDENLASAIRYATDNGAKIINLSFGKSYSKDKQLVDDAVRYAMCNDVLIIHAAGNDGRDLDAKGNEMYPNKYYLNLNEQAKAWLTVGATSWSDDSLLIPAFSNYGHTHVDVFAPGVNIYSTIPYSKYQSWSGTSMAAPTVSGIAAVIREYFPSFSAIQVKNIIMKSVSKVNHAVLIYDNGINKSTEFELTCVSGGIVNAFNAIKLAIKLQE